MPKARISGREKWKRKKWYTIYTPPLFGEIPIATVPADEDWKMIGRTIETTLYDITGDISQLHVHLKFQVVKVDGERAETIFKGLELARDYMRSLTRRKSSKVTSIINLETKDGYGIRVTAVVFTTYRCKSSQKRAIRAKMNEILVNESSQKTLDEFLQEIINNRLQSKIFSEAKKIYPVRKVEIAKIKLLTIPTPDGGKRKATFVAVKPV